MVLQIPTGQPSFRAQIGPMQSLAETPHSILDLVPYSDEKKIEQAFENAVRLAQHAEALGYHRFWMAEHHNLPGIASSATAILIQHVVSKTKTIRVGSGGIMLPNHSPLAIAEQFATLSLLYPRRIDLGLGRAPGSDQRTMQALRGHKPEEDFGEQVEELLSYFQPAGPDQRVRAIPGSGHPVPIVILGSSLYSAHLAARLGKPYAFAGHFAPAMMHQALDVYRQEFKSSETLTKPYVIVGVPIIAADTDRQAEFLATSVYQRFLSLVRHRLQPMAPPVDSMDGLWTEEEKQMVQNMMQTLIVGSVPTVRQGLEKLKNDTEANEFIITSDFYQFENRLRSYELIAEAFQK